MAGGALAGDRRVEAGRALGDGRPIARPVPVSVGYGRGRLVGRPPGGRGSAGPQFRRVASRRSRHPYRPRAHRRALAARGALRQAPTDFRVRATVGGAPAIPARRALGGPGQLPAGGRLLRRWCVLHRGPAASARPVLHSVRPLRHSRLFRRRRHPRPERSHLRPAGWPRLRAPIQSKAPSSSATVMAKKFWPKGDALGQRLFFGDGPAEPRGTA